MTENQRTLSGYKSAIHEPEDFENVNEGKPLLDDITEYVLKLMGSPRVINGTATKKKKDGSETKIDVERAVCEFEEKLTQNKVVAFFRVDSLNFAQSPDEEQFESGVIKFFKKIKHPLVEGVAPDWDKYFIPGMRFRSRVVVKTKVDKDKNVITSYYLDVPTVRPLLPSDKAGEDFAPSEPAQTSTAAPAPSALLANAKLVVHGAANMTDALQRLADAKVTDEVIAAFVQANGKGQITYPI
jgi:hypothetical protein